MWQVYHRACVCVRGGGYEMGAVFVCLKNIIEHVPGLRMRVMYPGKNVKLANAPRGPGQDVKGHH